MDGSARYRLLRGALRTWLAVSGRSLRVLGTGGVPQSAAVLYLCPPCSFLDALIMLAGCNRLLVVVTDREPQSRAQLLLAALLNVVSCGPEPNAWHSALRTSTEVLIGGGIVLVLEAQAASELPGGRSETAVALACEAWANAFPGQTPVILPVHRYYPRGRGHDIFVHIGRALPLDEQADGLVDDVRPYVNATLRESCSKAVFALDEGAFTELLSDLEHALQGRLGEQWQDRPAWNQKVDGFRLSSCAVESLRKLNRDDPGSLVALRELSGAQRETRRQQSLADLRFELGRERLSASKRVLGWTESIIGLPLAFYGLLNHLAAAFLLYVTGLVKRGQQAKPETWVARALLVLGCYGGQIALVEHVLGRAAAGYYALTLPVSGAYLFRYKWLLRRRAGASVLGVWAASLRSPWEATRKRLFETLDQILSPVGEEKTGGPKAAEPS
ncbi:MAG TPA: hypothetical protein VMT20_02405 [Terriglobia bacterium]|nr:hypothetical protein [Terriglobia bacterium]